MHGSPMRHFGRSSRLQSRSPGRPGMLSGRLSEIGILFLLMLPNTLDRACMFLLRQRERAPRTCPTPKRPSPAVGSVRSRRETPRPSRSRSASCMRGKCVSWSVAKDAAEAVGVIVPDFPEMPGGEHEVDEKPEGPDKGEDAPRQRSKQDFYRALGIHGHGTRIGNSRFRNLRRRLRCTRTGPGCRPRFRSRRSRGGFWRPMEA